MTPASTAEEVTDAFEAICQARLTDAMMVKTLEHDGAIAGDEFGVDTVTKMGLQVWGQGFLEPLFISTVHVGATRLMGEANDHLPMDVQLSSKRAAAVAFGMGPLQGHLGSCITMAQRVQIYSLWGQDSVQLLGEHILADELLEELPKAA